MASKTVDGLVGLVVAGIDFGTTYSGFGYGFKDGHIVVKNWHENGMGVDCLASYKAPTSLLLTPEGDFKAFGYRAEKMYAELADNDEHHGWRFFKHFKMMLHNAKVTHNTSLEDHQGRKLNAKTVFAHCIRYMKEDLVTMLQKRETRVKEGDILWIITVPAIWDEAAKQFMREAAKEAGISDSCLRLALEPEAASVHVKEISLQRRVTEKKTIMLEPFRSGTKYMVIDLGGGTVDVTVREVMPDRSLRELTIASGGAWGGAKVNIELNKLIDDIIGKELMQDLRGNHLSQFLDLDKEIEQKKRCLECDNQKKFVIKLPAVILEKFKEKHGITLSEHIKKSEWRNSMDLHKEKLRIDYIMFAKLFAPSIQSIATHVQDILSKPVCTGLTDILLVGGFAESKIISVTLRKHLSDFQLIIPPEAGLAVLRGAILFGLQPDVVSERISPYTYGTLQYRLFMEGDPISNKRKFDGQFYCKDVFNKLASAGETFRIGQKVETEIYPLTADMTQMPVSFYQTSSDPQYKDSSCKQIGHMLVDMPNTEQGVNRIVTVSLLFGDTEMQAEGVDNSSGEKVSVVLNFLSD